MDTKGQVTLSQNELNAHEKIREVKSTLKGQFMSWELSFE